MSITKKVVVNKVERKQYPDNKEPIYTVEIDSELPSTLFTDDGYDYVFLKNKTYLAEFTLEQVNGCCGVLELRSLSYTNNRSKNLSINDLTICLDKFVESNRHTFMINTNGKRHNIKWEQALEKSKGFVLVKTFVNPNSENTIKIWISNN